MVGLTLYIIILFRVYKYYGWHENMFENKRTFKEIENEEINRDLSLYYLYVYIKNYENETPENKRNIREYYNKELRYTNAFYRDRQTFKKYGHPDTWTQEKKKRFTVESYHKSYLSGMNIYKSFSYETTYLTDLDLNKPVSLVLIDIVENVKNLVPYEAETKTELTKLKKLMLRLDNKQYKIIIQKGFEPAYIYNLSLMQIIFKIKVNNHVRYISTNFVEPTFIISKGMNKLNNYLGGLVRLEGQETQYFSKPSNPKDSDIEIEFVEIERIFIHKRTDIFRHGIEGNVPYPYELTQNFLTSLVIQQ